MNKTTKSEVYSWRLSPALKVELEAAARAEKTNVATILDRLVRQWLSGRELSAEEDAEQQRRLHEQGRKAIGTVSIGMGAYTNQRVREVMGEHLEKKYRASQRRAPKRTN